MNPLILSFLLATFGIFGCQNQAYPLRDSTPIGWRVPLRSDSATCIGFGPYTWGKHIWVQVDSQAVGLRHGYTGQLLWSVNVPSHWLNDAWVLEEVGIQEGSLWMFEDSLALRIDPFTGQTTNYPYPLTSGTWTTRMAHPLDSAFLLPIYDAQGISLWTCDLTGNWTQIARHNLSSQQYAVLDGWAHWETGWAATLRTWDAASQSGQVHLWIHDLDSMESFPIAEDPGNGLPIIAKDGNLFIGTVQKVLAWSLTNHSVTWSTNLPFSWNLPGFTWNGDNLVVVNNQGETMHIQSSSGLVVGQYQLNGVSWIDRIRPGGMGIYLQWDRGIIQLQPNTWHRTFNQSTQIHHVVAVLPHAVVARDNRYVFSVGP